MLRMILLGVGTAVPDTDRENTHMVWEAPGGLLLIDAGGSTYQRLLRAALDPLKLAGIFLTHSHADHINGIPALLFQLSLAGFRGSLPIYGNAPTLELMQRVLVAFQLEQYQAMVDWRVVQGGDTVPVGDGSYSLRVADTVHPRPCLALRFDDPISKRALVYSADTEPCPAVQELAAGAHILIHEATVAKPLGGHSTPRQAGEVAAKAGAKKLVLVHFSPRYTMNVAQAIEDIQSSGFTGEAEVGREFTSYIL